MSNRTKKRARKDKIRPRAKKRVSRAKVSKRKSHPRRAPARPRKLSRKRLRVPSISPRQVAVRAQETAFQLTTSMDRGEVVPKFLRRYAQEKKRPGRIADPGRFRELIQTVRRESFLVLALQIESEAGRRFGSKIGRQTSVEQFDLENLFRNEFYYALGRCLDYSSEDFAEFVRDLEVYRSLRTHARSSEPPRTRALSSPRGPFVDRCGFLLDSPMLDQSRHAAAQFESELQALASAVLKKVLARRERS